MHMRYRSSSKSKFHSHVRFSRPLTYTIASSSNTAAVIRRFASLYGPVLPSQSMVISSQPGSARPVGSCQKFPWYGIRKNVMCENGRLFQYRYFFNDKFLVNPCRSTKVGMTMTSNSSRLCFIPVFLSLLKF